MKSENKDSYLTENSEKQIAEQAFYIASIIKDEKLS